LAEEAGIFAGSIKLRRDYGLFPGHYPLVVDLACRGNLLSQDIMTIHKFAVSVPARYGLKHVGLEHILESISL